MIATLEELHRFSHQMREVGNWEAALELLRLKIDVSTFVGVDLVTGTAGTGPYAKLLDEAFARKYSEGFWRAFVRATGGVFAR